MRRAGGIAVTFAAIALAAPALAQPAAETLGRQTYVALTEGAEVRATSALLRDSVNSLGGTCGNVERYQLFLQTVTVSTLKVACSGRPVYLLSVDASGGMLVDGGDGGVTAPDAADGVVVTVPALGAADPGDAVARTPALSEPAAMPAGPMAGGEAPLGWMRWLFALLALMVAGVAYTIYRGFTGPAVVSAGSEPYRRYTSQDKDRLVAESREMAPSLWAHPSGLYIVRGRNGKRRLFPSWMWAQAYRVWGIKIRQIR